MNLCLITIILQVGVISPGVPMEIALNKESKRKTPMYIGFRGDTRVFGEDAQTLNMRFPSTSFGYLNDLIGKSIENPVVDLYKYEIIKHIVVNTRIIRIRSLP